MWESRTVRDSSVQGWKSSSQKIRVEALSSSIVE